MRDIRKEMKPTAVFLYGVCILALVTFLVISIWCIFIQKPIPSEYNGECIKVDVYEWKDKQMLNVFSKVSFDEYWYTEVIKDDENDMIIIHFKSKEEDK